MDYINSNLCFVWFICVPISRQISYSWFLDCCSKSSLMQSVLAPALLASNHLFYFWVYSACHWSEILSTAPASHTMSEPGKSHAAVCDPAGGVTTLVLSPQYMRVIHQDEDVISYQEIFMVTVLIPVSVGFPHFFSIENYLCHFFICSKPNKFPSPHLTSKRGVIGIHFHSST